MPEPIRIDMSQKNNGLGEALMEAMFSGRPLVMFDSTRPELGDFGMGMDVAVADSGDADA